jgi:pyruvate/2-oxoglutarate dehydrogenase complex dihydrolipoamide dehydrogenase (E3) component
MNDGIKCSITVDEILLSIGRVPNVGGLELAAGGVDFDMAEGIRVDGFLCTTNADVMPRETYVTGVISLTSRKAPDD